MFKKKVEKVLFVAHPYMRGYAKLADERQQPLVYRYMAVTNVNSSQFEQLQEKMSKDNISVQWKC